MVNVKQAEERGNGLKVMRKTRAEEASKEEVHKRKIRRLEHGKMNGKMGFVHIFTVLRFVSFSSSEASQSESFPEAEWGGWMWASIKWSPLVMTPWGVANDQNCQLIAID